MRKYSFQTLLALVGIILGGATQLIAQTITADMPTTPTCIPSGFLGPSTASPPDGAAYRVGEPVLVESDPYFATLDFCGNEHMGQDRSVRSVRRRIAQAGVTSVSGGSDPTEVLHFNVPGTVTITRMAYHTFQGRIATTQNTLTIIDDGSLPFPEPVSAPPGEKVPRIERDIWPKDSAFRGVMTRDNEFQRITPIFVRNSGQADLVITAVYPWIYNSISRVFPVNIEYPLVLRPGQTYVFDLQQSVLDWAAYEAAERKTKHTTMILESNAHNRPHTAFATRLPLVYDTESDIPTGTVFPPPISVPADPTVCNDTNNDGTIDAGDIVTSILGSAQ